MHITLDLQNVHLKIDSTNIIILSSTSQKETQQTFLISYGVKRKKRLMWILMHILDKAKPYSPASKKCMLCLTEKYHIISSTKNLLNKCRHENKFYLANYEDIPP